MDLQILKNQSYDLRKDIIDLCQDNLFFTTYENEYINMICSFFAVEYIINILYPLLMFRFQPEQLSYQI